MGMAIGVSATGVPDTSTATGAAGGSNAERAYRQAVKALAQAQQQLAKHAVEHADEDTVKMDQQAVDMAAAALSQATSAMAAEARDAAEAQRAKTPVADGGAAAELGTATAEGVQGPLGGPSDERAPQAQPREARPASLGSAPRAVDEYL